MLFAKDKSFNRVKVTFRIAAQQNIKFSLSDEKINKSFGAKFENVIDVDETIVELGLSFSMNYQGVALLKPIGGKIGKPKFIFL